jgi:hypothetical protein
MLNPDPARITDSMWRLWTDRPDPTWRLGGIFANKRCYHNSVINNLRDWPEAYCIRQPLDLVSKNRDKARAIDYTMSTEKMKLYTARLKTSALNSNDDRLAAVREFYGTLDGKTVYGLIKDDLDGPWRRSSSDLSHLWHIHLGLFTAFVDDWSMLSPILSVLRGDSFVNWEGGIMLPSKGDSGQVVKYWQQMHNMLRNTVTPPSPAITVDGDYGSSSAAAFFDFWKKSGGEGATYRGEFITGWLALQYNKALVKFYTTKPAPITTPTNPIDETVIHTAIDQWLAANPDVFRFKPPTRLVLNAEVTDYQ